MALQTYSIKDIETDNVFEIKGFRPPTVPELEQLKLDTRKEYFDEIASGGYKYQSKIYDNLLSPEDRDMNLQKMVAVALNANITDVDVTTGVSGLFERTMLDFRGSPQAKMNYLQAEYGKDSVFAMVVDGKERFILDTKGKDNQPRYMFMDGEGFQMSDLGSASSEVLRTGVAIGAGLALVGTGTLDLGSGGLTKPFTLGLQLASAGYIADYGVDMFTKGLARTYDDLNQMNLGLDRQDYLSYMSEQSGQTLNENKYYALDIFMPKAGNIISKSFGNLRGVVANNLTKSADRLNAFYSDLNIDLKIAGNQSLGGKSIGTSSKRGTPQTPEQGLSFEKEILRYSPELNDMKFKNAQSLMKIQNALTQGYKEPMSEVQSYVAENITENYGKFNRSIAKGQLELEQALENTFRRELMNRSVDLTFETNLAGRELQAMFNKRNIDITKIKNDLYIQTGQIAKAEGVEYNLFDVYKTLKNALSVANDMPNDIQTQVLQTVSSKVNGRYKLLDELDALVKTKQKKGQVNRITFNQLDSIIKHFNEQVNKGYGVGTVGKEAFPKYFAGKLRELRDKKIIHQSGPKQGRPIAQYKGTGEALIKAKNFYRTKFLPYYDYQNGAQILERGMSGLARDEFLMQGDTVMQSVLQKPSTVDGFLKLLSPQDVGRAQEILQAGYMNKIGAKGAFNVSKSSQLNYNNEMVRNIFGNRTSTGALSIGKTQEALLRQKTKGLDDINNLAKKNPNMLLDLETSQIRQIFKASTPKEINAVLKNIENINQQKKNIYKFQSNEAVNHVANTGDFAQHPEMFTEYLLSADREALNNFKKYMSNMTSDINVDNIKGAIVEKIFQLAGKNSGKTLEIGEEAFIDPDTLNRLLKDNTVLAKNAKELLGIETVNSMLDLARVLKYSTPVTTETTVAGTVRPVFSNAGATFVLTKLPEMIRGKIMGKAITNDMMSRIFAIEQNPRVIADRLRKLFPLMIGTTDTFAGLVGRAETDASTMNFLQTEFASLFMDIQKADNLAKLYQQELQKMNEEGGASKFVEGTQRGN